MKIDIASAGGSNLRAFLLKRAFVFATLELVLNNANMGISDGLRS
jgi:hypothetical protein